MNQAGVKLADSQKKELTEAQNLAVTKILETASRTWSKEDTGELHFDAGINSSAFNTLQAGTRGIAELVGRPAPPAHDFRFPGDEADDWIALELIVQQIRCVYPSNASLFFGI